MVHYIFNMLSHTREISFFNQLAWKKVGAKANAGSTS